MNWTKHSGLIPFPQEPWCTPALFGCHPIVAHVLYESGQYEMWYLRTNSSPSKYGYAVAIDNLPPVAVCSDVMEMANAACEALVTAEEVDNGSFDSDGDPITLDLNPTGPFQLGLTDVTLYRHIDGKIYANYLEDVSSKVRIFSEEGVEEGSLPVPELSQVSVRRFDEDRLLITTSSFLQPSRTVLWHTENGEEGVSLLSTRRGGR